MVPEEIRRSFEYLKRQFGASESGGLVSMLHVHVSKEINTIRFHQYCDILRERCAQSSPRQAELADVVIEHLVKVRKFCEQNEYNNQEIYSMIKKEVAMTSAAQRYLYSLQGNARANSW